MRSFLSVIFLLTGAALIIFPGGCSRFFLFGSLPNANHGKDRQGILQIALVCSAVAGAI
jgi:hypothetical protein